MRACVTPVVPPRRRLHSGVVLLSWLANHMRVDALSRVDQFIMAYGGLRGAVAFSLVILLNEEEFPQKKVFVTTTVVVVYVTVFLQVAPLSKRFSAFFTSSIMIDVYLNLSTFTLFVKVYYYYYYYYYYLFLLNFSTFFN